MLVEGGRKVVSGLLWFRDFTARWPMPGAALAIAAAQARLLALLCEQLLGFHELRLARTLKQAIGLRVYALPARTFRLDPIAAWPAHVARQQALAHDALETELVQCSNSSAPFGKGLHLAQERYSRLAAEPIEIALAF